MTTSCLPLSFDRLLFDKCSHWYEGRISKEQGLAAGVPFPLLSPPSPSPFIQPLSECLQCRLLAKCLDQTYKASQSCLDNHVLKIEARLPGIFGSCKEDTPWHFTVRTLSKCFRTRKLQNASWGYVITLKFPRCKTIGFWQSSHSEMSRVSLSLRDLELLITARCVAQKNYLFGTTSAR